MSGGLGTKVIETVNNSNMENIKIEVLGYNDTFVKHGSVEELENEYKLDAKNIADKIAKSIEK